LSASFWWGESAPYDFNKGFLEVITCCIVLGNAEKKQNKNLRLKLNFYKFLNIISEKRLVLAPPQNLSDPGTDFILINVYDVCTGNLVTRPQSKTDTAKHTERNISFETPDIRLNW